MKVSAIIPCYNDHQHISKMVATLHKSKIIDEIIVVDDGSQATTKQVLENLKGIKLFVHPENQGKSQALKTGLLVSKNHLIMFLDADLIGLTIHHIQQLIRPITINKYDVTIGQFVDPFSIFVKIGQTTMLSGLRCYRREILLSNLKVFDNPGFINGYLIEVKSNQIIFNTSYHVAVTVLHNLTQKYKWQKGKFFDGAIKDTKMMIKILQYLGPKEYARQLLYCQQLLHLS